MASVQPLAPLVEISVTAEDATWLAAFARGLVEDRLVACGNVIPAVRSVYRWQGDVQDAQEALVLLHTRATLADTVVRRTLEEHPYDEPQVVVRPIVQSSPGYHRWVLDSTAATAAGVGDHSTSYPHNPTQSEPSGAQPAVTERWPLR